MSLHSTPARHDADPPSAWVVVKVADRCWHLDSSLPDGGTIGHYTRKRDAEANKICGPWVRMYELDGWWFAGRTPYGWRPWAECATDNAKRLGRADGKAGLPPLACIEQGEDEALWPALGITSAVTEDNAAERYSMLWAYCEAYDQAAEHAVRQARVTV